MAKMEKMSSTENQLQPASIVRQETDKGGRKG